MNDWEVVQRVRKTEEWVREKDAEDIAKAIMELEDAVEEMQDTRAELEAENSDLWKIIKQRHDDYAHLIVATTDLYDSLDTLLTHAGGPTYGEIEDARAALAKADELGVGR